MAFSLKNQTRRPTPRIPFEKIKNETLGESYELSFVLVGAQTSHKLNLSMRGKDKPTNVLSFPLSKDSGEIFIDLTTAQKEYKNFAMNEQKFVGYLFIHGLLHLKGMDHGATMEKAEEKLLKKFF